MDDDFYIYAHRGFSSLAIENTKGAICLAASKGYVDCIELDARMTKDNKLVLSHNNSLLDTTGDLIDVSELTYEEATNTLFRYSPSLLKSFSFTDPERIMMNERVKKIRGLEYRLTGLREGLRCCGDKQILLDLKFNNSNIRPFVEELLRELEGVDTSNIVFQSLNLEGIRYLQSISNFNCQALVNSTTDLKSVLDFDRIGIKYGLVSYGLVSFLLNEGKSVAIWTVNSTEVLEHLISVLGDHYKDVIYITDYPDLVALRLHEHEEEKPLLFH